MTSGSASHPGSKDYPPGKLAAVREQEAVTACGILGVEQENIDFLRLADSGMNQLDGAQIATVSKKLAAVFQSGEFTALALPWRRDPHADHVVTYQIGDRVLGLVGDHATKIEYPVWLWKNGSTTDWPSRHEVLPFRLKIDTVSARKQEAIAAHQSQLGNVVRDDAGGFVLTETILEPFRSVTEYFFLTNCRKPGTLKGDYFEGMYTDNADPWDFKNSYYEHEKYDLSLAALGDSRFHQGLEIGCSIGIQTKLLRKICRDLLAVDVSETALAEAKQVCAGIPGIRFKALDVSRQFPMGDFDLITLCEVGYYFDRETLEQLFHSIDTHLQEGGKLLMVHWTSYVPVYPLTGEQVHGFFGEFAERSGRYIEIHNTPYELFRIQVWLKSAVSTPR